MNKQNQEKIGMTFVLVGSMLLILSIFGFSIHFAYPQQTENLIIIHNASTPIFVHPKTTCTSSLTEAETGKLQEIICNGDLLQLLDVSTMTELHLENLMLKDEIKRKQEIISNYTDALIVIVEEARQ